MVYLILEKEFDPPLSEEQHDRDAQALDSCLVAHGVRWLRSYLSTDRRRMLCEFEAADAEAVRSSFRSAGVSFARVWAAHAYFPGGGAQGSWQERRDARAQPGHEQVSEARTYPPDLA
jgi:hypothetical protein